MERFTNAIRTAIQNENWFAGLFLTLCIPDICGALEEPNAAVGNRYKKWFNENLNNKYEMFTAEDCYYFRCSCLHQGFEKHEKINFDKVHFIPPPPRQNIVHQNNLNGVIQMQVDIFSSDMAEAADKWYKTKAKNNPEILSRMNNLIQIHPIESISQFIRFEWGLKLTSSNNAYAVTPRWLGSTQMPLASGATSTALSLAPAASGTSHTLDVSSTSLRSSN